MTGGGGDAKMPELPKEMQRLVEQEVGGINIEEHEITTEDGYILKTIRLNRDFKKNAPVVFLQHGLVDSSDAFIVNGEENSPAYILAREGYDVWMGNNRGNRFSRKHTSLNPDSWDKDEKYKFWNFSFQEMAEQDALANLNYITDKTGVP